MPQKFINNFDVVTSFAIGTGLELVIGDLLSGPPLARLTALLSGAGDWVELALISEAGAVENIRFEFAGDPQRDYAGNGSGALAWPAGSRLIAPYSAATAAAAKAANRPITAVAGDTLVLSPVGAWLWNPSFLVPITIDTSQLEAELGGEWVLPFAEVLLPSSDNSAPLVVKLTTAPAFVKLPAGGSGVYDSEIGSYEITLPPGSFYRFRFGGVASTRTLDVSDHSEYTAVA
ncbi:MAG: hypothetical protein K2X80_07760 [Pseudomonadaceae bacterium]|nr:hypothetical protein [Pseudomonadaceae bacterium]